MNLRLRFLLLIASVIPVTGARIRAADSSSPPASTVVAATSPGFKIVRDAPIQFPLVLLRDGIKTGEARVLLEVDADGRLVDSLVVAYTHEPFAQATLTALRRWRFEPARLNGEPVGTVADCTIVFNVDGVLCYVRTDPPNFEHRSALDDKYAYHPQEFGALDRIPTPRKVEAPVYPEEWAEQGMRGQVAVDFYIDQTGAVRMPSSAAGRFPLLAAAATNAIRKWRFAPPLLKGHPVLAHCRQVFTFERSPDPP